MSKDDNKIIEVTFDRAAAEFVIELLKVDNCASCGKKITPDNYGGSVNHGEVKHFHSNIVCMLDILKEDV